MKFAKLAMSLLLMAAFRSALAFTPAPGLWWNPSESGRGYTIDVQNNVMIVTAYVYTDTGAATWFLAAGLYQESNNTFSAPAGAYTGGQCWGCSYSAPNGVNAGQVIITFNSPESATLNYPGGSTQIQHELFAYANKTDYFLGEWNLSFNISGLVSSQWVVFNSHYTGTDGTVYASGHEDGLSGTVALGAYYPTLNVYIAGVADSSGFSNQYIYTLGDDRRMLGLGVIFPTGTTPPTPTDPAAANRLLFESELVSVPLLSSSGGANEMATVNNDAAYAKLAQQIREVHAQYVSNHSR